MAATNKDMRAAVEAGDFRADLYYRLNVIPIHIPPLKERIEDLASQIDYFVLKYSGQYNRGDLEITPEVRAALSAYNWPGNTRELENVIERMVLLSEGNTLARDNLPAELTGIELSGGDKTLKGTRDAIYQATERKMIMEALDKTGGKRTKASKVLGISRRTLQNKIKEYQL